MTKPNLIVKLLLVASCICILAIVVNRVSVIPVVRWAEYHYSDTGVTIYECASPSYWEKWINSTIWQEWKVWSVENEVRIKTGFYDPFYGIE